MKSLKPNKNIFLSLNKSQSHHCLQYLEDDGDDDENYDFGENDDDDDAVDAVDADENDDDYDNEHVQCPGS